jgi:hypothetical protein
MAQQQFDSIDILNNIIETIKLKILFELQNKPCVIYIGIGVFAGSKRIDNGIEILDDENYHQFPPALQNLYNENNDLNFFCIYIDPYLEQNPFFTKDDRMRQKLNLALWTNHNNFCYENNRINVYPFRNSIKVNSTRFDMYPPLDYLNITQQLEGLHQFCIEENVMYVYHDFSGNENIKFINEYFSPQISNNLDHIIYGIGDGNISGCYYDFRKSEAMFAYNRTQTPNRICLKVFNLNKVISDYKSLDNSLCDLYYDFTSFLSNHIESYKEEQIEIITSIMNIFVENFTQKFKDHILYMFRIIKNDIQKFEKNEEISDIDFMNYNFQNIIGIDSAQKIQRIYKEKENLFDKIIMIIAEKFHIELELIGMKRNLKPFEILSQILSNPNMYSWSTDFNSYL